jgi:hypothetical protein
MSNTFAASPPIWVLDSPSGTPVTTEIIRIYRIRWVAGPGSVAGGECKITDQLNNRIFDEFSTGADFETFDMTMESSKGKNVNGLILTNMASGQLYLYLA